MAKVYRKDGAWQFNYSMDGKQKQFYLGTRHDYRSASTVEKIVRELLDCRYRNERPGPGLLEAISRLDSKTRDTIKRHGLEYDCMRIMTLGELIDRHRPTKADKKKGTITLYESWYGKMSDYFGDGKLISEITSSDVEMFRVWLLVARQRKLSVATVARGFRTCRTIFGMGVKLGCCPGNPFTGCFVGADHNDDRQYYVSREKFESVLSFCKSDRFRFVAVLARYAGLRIPSEIRFMKFSDFGKDGFFVHHDTKTGKREVPFFRELRPVFERLRESAGPDDLIFPLSSWRFGSECRRRMTRMIELSGVAQWPRLFNNLRSSCIMDYDEMGYSQKTLDSIFGNSEEIRRKHYIGFRRDRSFMRMLNGNIPIVELLSSLGGTFENGLLGEKEIDTIISSLSSLKTSLVSNSPEIPIYDKVCED